jgi:hypothetical protein
MTFPVFIKASKTRVSIAKEIKEVNRLRMQFERSMTSRLMLVFKRTGKSASAEYMRSGDINQSLVPLENDLRKVFEASYRAVIEKFADRVYTNRKADRFSQLVFDYTFMNAGAKITGIAETTGKIINKAILDGEKEGIGVSKIGKLIQERTSGSIGRSRAVTIARTETHAAASYATDTATRELALPAQRKRWVSVSDDRTRTGHSAANGQEVGIDEKFLVPYKGATVEMSYPHDGSGGAGNNINCRCLAIYFTDEDALFDDATPVTPVAPVVPVPQVPVAPVDPINISPFKTYAVTNTFKSPVIDSYNNESFPVMKPKEAYDRLRKDLKEASENVGYNSVPLFQGVKTTQYGRMYGNFQNLEDDVIKMMAVINTELNYFSDFLEIPRMRGYNLGAGRAIASQGDGVMNINPEYFARFAKDMRDPTDPKIVSKKLSIIDKELVSISDELIILSRERNKLLDDRDAGIFTTAQIFDRLEAIKAEIMLKNQRRVDLRQNGRNLEKYEKFDNYTIGGAKPYTSEKYFNNGLDHMRSTMYHEFGHHIHQYLKAQITSNGHLVGRPTEAKVKKYFLSKFKFKKKREKIFSTRYAEQDAYEWFAEQFSLFAMNRKDDLVTTEFLELLEELFNGKKFR